MQSPTGQLYCDFCGKGEEDCNHIIISGPDQQGAAICSTCILVCVDAIFQRAGGHPLAAPPGGPRLTHHRRTI